MNLGELLAPDAGGDGPDVLVFAGEQEVTRAQLRSSAEVIAGTLRDAGVGAGSPVAVMLPNAPTVVAALFGVWAAGAVYVPVNPRLTDPEVDRVLATVPVAAVVTTEDHAARFARTPVLVLESVGGVRCPPRSPEGDVGVGVRAYDADIALVQMTSGTTGEPKPVLLTHSGVMRLLDGVLDSMGGTARRARPMPNLVPVSLSLWAGIYQVLFAFRVGAPVVLMERFEPRELARLVARFGITSVVLPPAAMAMLADDATITTLAPLKRVRSITAPLSPFQARRFHDRFGVAVLNCYGQTEIGGEIVGWSAADWREHGDDKLGAVGRPHEGVEVQVVDADGAPLAPGEIGELWVRTPALAAGYADGRDFSDRVRDGWFRTGDLGRVDPDGFVWIDGRASEMINRGGMKVHPGEVEEVVRAAEGVGDVAVVGLPDDRLGEVPVAFVEAGAVEAGSGALDGTTLEAHCRRHLAPYKVPVRFEVVPALPRNDIGKVRKAVLVAAMKMDAMERSG